MQRRHVISRFTGKCDFFDDCEMIRTPEEIVGRSDIYLGDAKVEIKTPKDLIPYYTHIVSSACYTQDNGNSIHLSKESFIDSEEKEFLVWRIMDAIKFARKAKKEKKPFDLNYFKAERNDKFDTTPDFLWKKIISIVNGQPEIIKMHISKDYCVASRYITDWVIPNYFYDVHDPNHNRSREEFVKYCEEEGFSVIKDRGDYRERTEGIYHPIITRMCMKIEEYYRMERTYK